MTNQRPLPDEIYVRRRVGALVVLLILVVLVVWGLSAVAKSGNNSGDGSDAAVASTDVTPSITPVTEPTVPAPEDAESSTSATTEVTATDAEKEGDVEASASEESLAKGSCELSDLRITALTEFPSFKVGDSPKIFMEVENPTDTDCVLDLNDGDMRFEVYDMATNARVWSDTDCYASIVVGQETFPAGEKRPYQAVWSGTASAPGACTDRKTVPAGSYYLHAVIGDNASDAAPFNFTA